METGEVAKTIIPSPTTEVPQTLIQSLLGEHATANIGQISVQMMAVSSIDVISNSNQKETIQIFHRKGNAFER